MCKLPVDIHSKERQLCEARNQLRPSSCELSTIFLYRPLPININIKEEGIKI